MAIRERLDAFNELLDAGYDCRESDDPDSGILFFIMPNGYTRYGKEGCGHYEEIEFNGEPTDFGVYVNVSILLRTYGLRAEWVRPELVGVYGIDPKEYLSTSWDTESQKYLESEV